MMSVATLSQLITGVLLNACAQLLLKGAALSLKEVVENVKWDQYYLARAAIEMLTNIHLLGGLALYAVSVGLWVIVLGKVPVNVAYPMLSVGYVFNAVMAYLVFDEKLAGVQVVGLIIIIIGVVLLNQK